MSTAVHLDMSRGPRGILAELFAGFLILISLLVSPHSVQAQGPSLAVKEIWTTGADKGAFVGASATMRPPGQGVAISIEWAKHGGIRLLAGSMGYSLHLMSVGSTEVYIRPAVGAAEVRRQALPKRLLALSTDLEVSRPLFGLRGWRGLLGVGGSANLSLKETRCLDCGLAGYEDGFGAFGVYVAVMRSIR